MNLKIRKGGGNMNFSCSACGADLRLNHLLEDCEVSPMSNHSQIFAPKCALCGHPIALADVANSIQKNRKILLITGTAGAGKTALGQRIACGSDYVFVDGDAVQKRVHFLMKRNPKFKANCQTETLHTAMTLLALGYDVVVGYIINRETLKTYTAALAKYGIVPTFRVLVPERAACLARDESRECWTAGAQWVDQWYDEMRSYLKTHPALCIDSSGESLEETFQTHFAKLL